MKNITIFLVSILFVCYFSDACAGVGSDGLSSNAINSVIERYISAEEKQDYGGVYLLFDRRMREQLQRKNGVMSAKDYMKLRQSSEARWFDFLETERTVAGKEATLMFSVTIEESGEKERVQLTLRLVIQEGRWQIDNIRY